MDSRASKLRESLTRVALELQYFATAATENFEKLKKRSIRKV